MHPGTPRLRLADVEQIVSVILKGITACEK
jgi:hypothetical protein